MWPWILSIGLLSYSIFRKQPKPIQILITPTTIPKQVLCFSNNHWNNAYLFGVAKFIQEYLDTSLFDFKGISFGSMVVMALEFNVPIESIYQSMCELYHSNRYYFIWNYYRRYNQFINQWFKHQPLTHSSYWVLQNSSHFIEISNIFPKELLSLSYGLPFPSIFPRKMKNYGYVKDCYWNPPDIHETYICLTDSSSFPTPIELQLKSWFHPPSKEHLDILYEIGYYNAFLFFHQPSWFHYFKNPPQLSHLREKTKHVEELIQRL